MAASATPRPAAGEPLPPHQIDLELLHPSAGALSALHAAVWASAADPALLELCRLRIASIVPVDAASARWRTETALRAGLDSGKLSVLEDWRTSPRFDAREQAFIDFAEQFATSVRHISREQALALGEYEDDVAVLEFVSSLYALEMIDRAATVAAAIFGRARVGAAAKRPDLDSVSEPVSVQASVAAFRQAVERASSLDLATTELVRLRCAEYHNCRACMSFRNEDAIALGVDEMVVRALDRYEEAKLPASWKVALRLVDALIINPSAADAALESQLRACFSDEHIAQIIFDVMKWSDRKVHVSLGLDAPQHDGISAYRFDAAGRCVLGAPIDDVALLYAHAPSSADAVAICGRAAR
jgi:alkylhydroperoxidase family enzyme